MEHKNKPAPAARIWALYLIVGVLFMAGVVFFSNWKALCTTEERFCQILNFVKSQSTRYEKYNDTVAAKTLRRTAVSVQELADDPALDFSDPQCLKKEAERLWLTGISVLDPEGTLLCEYTANGVGYARFGDQLGQAAARPSCSPIGTPRRRLSKGRRCRSRAFWMATRKRPAAPCSSCRTIRSSPPTARS